MRRRCLIQGSFLGTIEPFGEILVKLSETKRAEWPWRDRFCLNRESDFRTLGRMPVDETSSGVMRDLSIQSGSAHVTERCDGCYGDQIVG